MPMCPGAFESRPMKVSSVCAAKPVPTLQLFEELLLKVGTRPSSFILPALLVFLGAILEGISLYLLMAVVRGSIKMDFGFIRVAPHFGRILSWFPESWRDTDGALFLVLSCLIFAASLLKVGLSYFGTLRCAYLGRRFADQMRRTLFERSLGFGKLFFDHANVGQIQHTLLDSTESVVGRFISINEALTYLFLLGAYLFIMFVISWKLTLGVMLAFPIIHYTVRWLVSRVRVASRSHAESRMKLGGYVSGILSNLLLVRASAHEEGEKRRFKDLSAEVVGLSFAVDERAGLVVAVQEILFLGILLAILFVLMFVSGNQHVGLVPDLLVYVYLVRKASTALSILGRVKANLAVAYGPIMEVLQLLDDGDKAFVPDGTEQFSGLRDKIEFRKLTYAYPGKEPVLRDISFSVDKGRMTAVVGPSGTGKTTLINLVLRFYDPPQGTIFLDDSDIRDLSAKSLRTRVALISQDTQLFNDTVRMNVTYPFDKTVAESALLDALRRARLYDFVMGLPQGLETPIGHRGVKLSGGEKQRVSIARAILRDAEILVLDEATSSLDSQTEALIQASIEDVVRGRTAIVIAHRLSTIKNADKIVVVEGGRVVEQGSRQELLDRKGHFARYWEAQKPA